MGEIINRIKRIHDKWQWRNAKDEREGHGHFMLLNGMWIALCFTVLVTLWIRFSVVPAISGAVTMWVLGIVYINGFVFGDYDVMTKEESETREPPGVLND